MCHLVSRGQPRQPPDTSLLFLKILSTATIHKQVCWKHPKEGSRQPGSCSRCRGAGGARGTRGQTGRPRRQPYLLQEAKPLCNEPSATKPWVTERDTLPLRDVTGGHKRSTPMTGGFLLISSFSGSPPARPGFPTSAKDSWNPDIRAIPGAEPRSLRAGHPRRRTRGQPPREHPLTHGSSGRARPEGKAGPAAPCRRSAEAPAAIPHAAGRTPSVALRGAHGIPTPATSGGGPAAPALRSGRGSAAPARLAPRHARPR